MRMIFKIIGFIIADIIISVLIILAISSLSKAGVLGSFGDFWNGLVDVIDATNKWILDVFGVAHKLG